MTHPPLDAVIIGGGPAGLQAALTLGRMHRAVLLVDSGDYRNAPAREMHNFISRDGTSPAELRALARAELAAYDTVALHEGRAALIEPRDGGFVVELAEGDRTWTRRVVLATGVRDSLPDKPGLADLFGTVAVVCPYCHGHELTGQPVAIMGSGPHVARVAMLLSRIAGSLTVLADGDELDADTATLLEANGVTVRPEVVTEFCRSPLGATASFEDGPTEEFGGVFVASAFQQAAPFADQLGLDLLPSGCIEVDAFGRTSVPGVLAAGDLAHTAAVPMPLASVLTAAAAGLVAAATVDQALLAEDHGLPVPA